MKQLLAAFAIGAVCVCLVACGSTNKAGSGSQTSTTTEEAAVSTTPTNAPPAPAQTKPDADNDNDFGAIRDEPNNDRSVDFGHEADPSDKRAVTALIKRYYGAAVKGEGAKACSMLYSTLEESVPEDYGISPPSKPYLRGTTCPAVLSLLFKHYHPQLALEYPRLEVARVRLIEHHGITILHFGKLPEREIVIAREGHTWKLDALIDSEMH
jgi:hypothetical protein